MRVCRQLILLCFVQTIVGLLAKNGVQNTIAACYLQHIAGILPHLFHANVYNIVAGTGKRIYYLPALIPPVAATIAFVFVFNPATGPVNELLGAVGIDGPGWFTDPAWAKPSLVLLGLWVLGDIMVIFLASLLDVPTEQYEAAELDGANAAQQFRFVTVPHLSPVLLFALITGIIGALQYFTEPAVASSTALGKSNVGQGAAGALGWPDQSTLTYGQLLYAKAFGANLLGYASAMAVVLFVVAAIVMAVLLRRFRSFSPDVAS